MQIESWHQPSLSPYGVKMKIPGLWISFAERLAQTLVCPPCTHCLCAVFWTGLKAVSKGDR